jgi:hypothetical protein
MKNYIYFAENLVTTGGNTQDADKACMLPADSYLGAEPVNATTTKFIFSDPIRLGSALGYLMPRITVTLKHANEANGGGFKKVVKAFGSAISAPVSSTGGFVVFADEEEDNPDISGAGTKTGGTEYYPEYLACGPDSSTTTAGGGGVRIDRDSSYSTSLSGAGVVSGETGSPEISVVPIGHSGRMKVSIRFDLTDLKAANGVANDCVALAAGAGYLLQWQNERYGVPVSARMSCLEVPAGASDEVDLNVVSHADDDKVFSDALGTDYIINGDTWTLGKTVENLNPTLVDNEYLYIANGTTTGDDSAFTAGKFLLEIIGILVDSDRI